MGSSHSSSFETEPPGRHVLVWKIDGFKSLLEQGEGWISTPFEMHGNTWYLNINLMDEMDKKSGDKSSEKHVSLTVSACVSADYMLETKFKVFIQDQIYGKHAEHEVSHTYMMGSSRSGVDCMVPLKTLKSRYAGFLTEDTIAVGVEFIQFKKVPYNGLETRGLIQKKMSTGSYCWCIEDFFQLDRPTAFSKPFQIAGYTWRIKLHPEGVFNKDYVSLYLALDKSESQLLPSSGVMVDVVFSIKRSQSGAYNIRYRHNFTGRNSVWGYSKFIRQDQFIDPMNGYLIKGRCTFETSISIFGSANDHASVSC